MSILANYHEKNHHYTRAGAGDYHRERANGEKPLATSSTVTIFAAGPFVRYYFNAGPKVKIFVHGDASWGSEKVSCNSGGNEQSQPGIPISIYEGKAGAAYFLNPAVALEFIVGYQSLGGNFILFPAPY